MDRQVANIIRRNGVAGAIAFLVQNGYVRRGARDIVRRVADGLRAGNHRSRPRIEKNLFGAGAFNEAPPTIERPVKRQRRMDPVGGFGAPYVNDLHVKRKRTLGRITTRKIAKQGTSAIYDRWQKMGLYGRASGSFNLSREETPLPPQDGVGDAGPPGDEAIGVPLYLWDLTACRNTIGGAEYCPQAAFRLMRFPSNGSFAWLPLRGQNVATGADGTNLGTAGWQVYSKPKHLTMSPFENGLLDWVKVQGVFWGSKYCSHKVWIQLVQTDAIVQPRPDENPIANPLYTNVNWVSMSTDELGQGEDANTYYTNIVARNCDSPFATWGKEQRKANEKILDQKVLEFTPVASYEEGGLGLVHKQTFNAYFKMGRKCNFAWENDVSPDETVLGDQNIETDIEAGNHSCFVHPRARVFLRIMAQVFNSVDGGNFTSISDCSPTFDIRITRKWVISE